MNLFVPRISPFGVETGSRNSKMPLDPVTKSGPELWHQIDEAGPGDAREPIRRSSGSSPALTRVISVRQSGAHRGSQNIRAVACRSAGIVASHYGMTDCVQDPLPLTVTGAQPNVTGVLMECGSEKKVAEEILADDVAHRRPEPLGIGGRPFTAVKGCRIRGLRYGCVKRCRAGCDWSQCLGYKQLPLFPYGRRLRGGRSGDCHRPVRSLSKPCRRNANTANPAHV